AAGRGGHGVQGEVAVEIELVAREREEERGARLHEQRTHDGHSTVDGEPYSRPQARHVLRILRCSSRCDQRPEFEGRARTHATACAEIGSYWAGAKVAHPARERTAHEAGARARLRRGRRRQDERGTKARARGFERNEGACEDRRTRTFAEDDA